MIELMFHHFAWMLKRETSLQVLDLSFPPIHVAQETARQMGKNDELRSRILALIRDADFGISGIDVSETPAFPPLPVNAPDELREFISNIQSGLKKLSPNKELIKFSVTTKHTQHETGEAIRFNLEDLEVQ